MKINFTGLAGGAGLSASKLGNGVSPAWVGLETAVESGSRLGLGLVSGLAWSGAGPVGLAGADVVLHESKATEMTTAKQTETILFI